MAELKSVKLTNREQEVLKYVIQGQTNAQIAKELCISSHTVKSHVERMYRKLKVHRRINLVVKAIQAKIICVDES